MTGDVVVVIPAYQAAPFLAEAVESARAQEYEGLRIVVVDDGSTDETPSVAAALAGDDLIYLRQDNAGPAAARNAGIWASNRPLVAFLDADAYCHPEWPYHLVLSLEDDGVVATGGPNLPAQGAGLVEQAVAASPGIGTNCRPRSRQISTLDAAAWTCARAIVSSTRWK